MIRSSATKGSFWFRPISASGFGLMRVGFGVVGFVSFLLQWTDITRYFSDDGLLPRSVMREFLRSDFRFSVLDVIGDPTSVFLVYLILLACFALIAIGFLTRPALLVGVLLLFSFHERMPVLLAGGDTVLRLLGFLLLISPCDRSFSLTSFRRNRRAWKKKGADPRTTQATMSIWPWRLLLWQFLMIYVASFWTKILGTMWEDGSAVGIALRHEHFLRFPLAWVEPLSFLTKPFAFFLLASQLSWLLFLIIPIVEHVIPRSRKMFARVPWRLCIIGASAVSHLSIALFLDVGIFSFIILAGYLGLLREEEFAKLRRLFNGKKKRETVVLYDGSCGFCRDTVFVLMTLDHLRRLTFIDLHAPAARKVKSVPARKILMQELHVRRNGRWTKGFFAFRTLASDLPVLWMLDPFLWLPGVDAVGVRVYRMIAGRRSCTSGACRMHEGGK